jgi:hypothetical protein
MNSSEHAQSCSSTRAQVNLSDVERGVSVVLGGALVVRALQKMDVVPLALAALGVGLIFRGASGYCSLYDMIRVNGARKRSGDRDGRAAPLTTSVPSEIRAAAEDQVAEASLESFPASDAPAWTSVSATPMPARTPRIP